MCCCTRFWKPPASSNEGGRGQGCAHVPSVTGAKVRGSMKEGRVARAEPERIEAMLADEMAGYDVSTRAGALTLADFRARRVRRPRPVRVQFAGAVERVCWTVTRSDGCYSVLFVPGDEVFALCVDSDFGPLDIGVHGRALACFASV